MPSLKDLILQLSPEQQQRIARYVASMPESVGGLNMPLTNTAQQRAAALGFNTPTYHATLGTPEYSAFSQLDPALADKPYRNYWDLIGTHTGSREAAEEAYELAKDFDDTTTFTGPHTYPLLIKGDKPFLDPKTGKMWEDYVLNSDFNDYARTLGTPSEARQKIFKEHDVIPYINQAEDIGSTSYISPPENIRSRFAAFNPWLKDSSNTMASVAAGGLFNMARQYLDQPMDMGPDVARVAKETGIQPMSRGEYLKNAVSAVPGIGDALAAAEGLQGAAEGDWIKAGLGALGALAAMPMIGAGSSGGLRSIQKQLGAINVYHGSPRAKPFTRFNSEFMGSGEGAQAFGKGHYLAERPGIAKGYVEMRGPMFRPLEVEGASESTLDYLQRMADYHKSATPEEVLNNTVATLKAQLKYAEPEEINFFQTLLHELEDKQISQTRKPRASLYEVSLEWPGARESVDPMSREHFFQWDKQFSSQPKHVKDALFDIIEQHPEIADPYAEWLAKHHSPGHTTHSLLTLNPQSTIKALGGTIEPLLYERGVPGIAFLDQPSRTKKVADRTYNYVAFGDEIPRIISHNKPSVLDMLWPKK